MSRRQAFIFAQGDAGLAARAWGQTLFRPLAETTEVEPVRPGVGKGAFVVVAAERTRSGGEGPGRPNSRRRAGAAT